MTRFGEILTPGGHLAVVEEVLEPTPGVTRWASSVSIH